MKPILFAETATTYTTNGIGRLSDAISCVVTEERNGMYELAMVYPVTGRHYSDIGIRKIIVAKPFEGGSLQAFRIYEISKPINGKVEVCAQHVSYDLSKNVAMPFSVNAASTACASALAGLKTNAVETCPFTFWTDVTTASSYNQAVPASIRSRLGGVEGSVLDQFGGEYEWDNWTVKLHRQRGRVNTGISLRYGKNITDLVQEENIASTVTGMVPFWNDSDGNLVTLDEKAVYSQYASRYSTHLTEVKDMSGDFETQPTKAQLKAAAEALVNKSTYGLPKVSIEVSFVALWQTEEYKDIAPLESVNLCDEITVHFDRLGVDATAKVVKTEYDVLNEKYVKVHIGSARSSLSQIIDDNNAMTIQAIAAQKVETSTAINNATKWLTTAGGYVIAIKNPDGTWKELVFSNMTDPYDDHAQILRINNNGIGFAKYIDSSHKGGMNGYFRNAWTIDGNLIADFIHGGTLTLGGNGNGNGWLKMLASDGATEIGRWDVNGIKVYKGSLNGASVTIGGVSNGSGTLTVKGVKTVSGEQVEFNTCVINNTGIHLYNADGTSIGGWSSSGIDIDSGDINLGSGVFHVTNAGALTASSATITGKVTATSGKIGGFTIEEDTTNDIARIYHTKTTRDSSANGVYIGKDGIAIGASSKFKVTNEGALTAKSGTVGGFTITDKEIYSGTATTSTASGAIAMALQNFARTINNVSRNLRFAIGSKFGISADGDVYASNVNIKGAIEATSGSFTGEIKATSGTIGSNATEGNRWKIGDRAIWNGCTGVADTTNAGTYIGVDGIKNARATDLTKYVRISNGEIEATAGTFKGSLNGASITGATGTFSGSLNVNERFKVSSTGQVSITTQGASSRDDYLIIKDPSGNETVIGGEYIHSTGASESVRIADLLNYYIAHR